MSIRILKAWETLKITQFISTVDGINTSQKTLLKAKQQVVLLAEPWVILL